MMSSWARPVRTSRKRTKELIQRTLDFYNAGITVTSVNLTDVQVPDAGDSFAARCEQGARRSGALREGSTGLRQRRCCPWRRAAPRACSRMLRATTRKLWRLAEGQASRFTQLAQAYAQAPDVTRKRLYLETIETILARSHKVLIDAKGATAISFICRSNKLLDRAALKEPEVTTDSTPRATARRRLRDRDRRRPQPYGPLMLRRYFSAAGGACDRASESCSPRLFTVQETQVANPHRVRRIVGI